MATIEQFNAEIENVKKEYTRVIVAMLPDGFCSVNPVQWNYGRGKDPTKRAALEEFNSLARGNHAGSGYEHIALIWRGHVMAIWHAQPATGTAEAAFGVGDYVMMGEEVKGGVTVEMLKQYGAIGNVVGMHEEKFGQVIDVDFWDNDGEYIVHCHIRPELISHADIAALSSAARPATGKVGSDADLLDEDVYIDEPVNSKPLRVVTVDNCCDEVEALIQERDKLLRSEDAYHVENERLRAALFKISRLIAPPGELIAMGGDGYIMRVLHIIDEALADAKPEPKTTTHYVTVMPSIGDKVRIRKAAEQDTEYLINAQKLGAVGVIVGFDGLEVKVEFGSSEADTWMLTFSELEIVELNPYARQSLAE